ncbi:PREDICTED: E3 ubiquitin-protein ligase SGR9, amyloplastic-like [Tarenaya hassleriana]|uniref:E3 ubiquitin-protein ligase SGR9, amyloplastic-like n=1 Tax=Tarenaya hassleriana TaxID=28532 RepID=UPI00053C15B3|nr:PREDICTED: E3 ubiquitin-protein ligase SGR9, amyloplastic-like [Tarenaya hassleriana]
MEAAAAAAAMDGGPNPFLYIYIYTHTFYVYKHIIILINETIADNHLFCTIPFPCIFPNNKKKLHRRICETTCLSLQYSRRKKRRGEERSTRSNMEEETIINIMSTLSPERLRNLSHSILTLSHHHCRRLSAVLSSPALFSLTLSHLLSLDLPHKTILIARHLLSLLHLYLRRPPPSPTAAINLRDCDAAVLLLFLCETHQLDPDILEASLDRWREVLSKLYSDSMLNGLSGLWTCNSGILMPYVETLVRCKSFVDRMSGGGGKEGKEVAAARAAVVALRAVEVVAGDGGGVECVICKEEMREGRDVCEMPCRHLFHWKCILPWLSKRNTCPSCRFQLPTDDVFAEIQRLWEILFRASESYVA